MAMTDFAVSSQFHVAVDAGPRYVAIDPRPGSVPVDARAIS
jgi:hypothetical protein